MTWGVEKCPSVAADPSKAAIGRRGSISSPLKPTPPGRPAWQGTSRSSGAYSNACGRTARNREATRRAPTATSAILVADLAPSGMCSRLGSIPAAWSITLPGHSTRPYLKSYPRSCPTP